MQNIREAITERAVVSITETTLLVSYLWVKSPQLIWRLAAGRGNKYTDTRSSNELQLLNNEKVSEW